MGVLASLAELTGGAGAIAQINPAVNMINPAVQSHIWKDAPVAAIQPDASGKLPRGAYDLMPATPSDNLYVWNLPVGADDNFLRELFCQVGNVVSVKCILDRRYGFVRFSS